MSQPASRTRFAPSPTGYLHIGGVRTALFNWLLSRQSGGQFILRIDDTDSQRNQAEALQPILDGFEWLGIDWDEGPTSDGQSSRGPHSPYFQSQRLAPYQAAVKRLLASGHAYRDFAKPEETAAERAEAEANKVEFTCSRRWMAETDEQAARFEAEGRVAVVRLKMPREGVCRIDDLIRGPVEFEWVREQDHVIQRNDGTCLYHLASVVDDFEFGITHVVRAVEHLSNTPRQIFIAQSLGYALPHYAHIPFVAEPGSKTKLSKRKIDKYLKNADFKALVDRGLEIARRTGIEVSAETFNPVLVDFYRQTGFLPDAVVNYLLLLGWSLDGSREDFSREEMIAAFSLDRVVKSEASFDPQKLLSFQHRYMQRLPEKQKVAMVLPFLQRAGLVSSPPPCEIADRIRSVVAAAGDRLVIAGDILQCDEFFRADDDLPWDEAAFEKKFVAAPDVPEILEAVSALLASLPRGDKAPALSERGDKAPALSVSATPSSSLDAATTESALKDLCNQRNWKIGSLMLPLRLALTGKTTGIGLFDAISILGRESALRRIERALARRAAASVSGA
jgi:glutamyl-tRNA synthetase